MADDKTMNDWKRWLPLALMLALVAALILPTGERAYLRGTPDIPYTKFRELVSEKQVSEVVLRGHRVEATLRSPQPLGPEGAKTKEVQTRVPEFGSTDLLARLEERNVQVRVEESQEGRWNWLIFLLPWVIILGLYFWFWRRMASAQGGGIAGLTRSKAKRVTPDMPQTTFDDVAGQETAKREVQELIDYLRDPERYRKVGAEAPHGLLLIGPPGTGKTLMARALAGEANVPFFHMSGSEFIEMVVGVGAARVRQTFEQAKKQQPSILFVDELDAIGRVRGAGLGGGHDEREQTLNQILSEMDGFAPHEAVVVVAATNRPDVLDPALLRPGRFDRRVALDLPDRKGRKQILELHTGRVPLSDDVDLGQVAAGTPGFSGADLKNLVNEAAMLAAREKSEKVEARHFDEARDKVMMGPSRPLGLRPEERHRLAVHECGHTAVAHYLPKADPIYKVTIVPRGQSLGGTHQLPEQERYTMPEDYLRDRLAVMLAGRTAEQIFLGNISSGADADIQQATRLARAMVTRWGMSEEIGPVDLRISDDNPFLGREIARQREFSDTTAHAVDEAVRHVLEGAEECARKIIEDHRGEVEKLVSALEEHETLDRDAIEGCLGRPATKDKARQARRASA